MDTMRLHELFLYPAVRIFADKAAGSGTVIYCKEDPDNPGEFITLCLTNEHVIDDLLTVRKDWDSLLKKNIDKEFLKRGHVEIFSYIRQSIVDSSNRYNMDVVCYDKHQDLAIIKIDSPKQFSNVATLIPREEIKNLYLFQEVVVSGCSLAHEPFCNFGQITFLNEIIDERRYIMSNCNSIFGNSGGALYLVDKGWLIGVPSRITGIQLGFGFDVTSWMGFSVYPERFYEFFDQQEMRFLYDPSDSYKAAMKRREEKEKQALLALREGEHSSVGEKYAENLK